MKLKDGNLDVHLFHLSRSPASALDGPCGVPKLIIPVPRYSQVSDPNATADAGGNGDDNDTPNDTTHTSTPWVGGVNASMINSVVVAP